MPVLRSIAFSILALVLTIGASRAAEPRYASIVIDAQSGQVLSATDENERRYPASLTKMMTLYLVFESLRAGRLTLDQTLPVSSHAASRPPSRLGLKRGQKIRVRDAILALTTKSANDAAVVLAEAVGGTETAFARKMTAKARELGMTRTVFRNASGLPDRGQVSTARDMARLSQALVADFPERYHFFSARSFSWGGRTYRTHNHLLNDYGGVDGIKTGYIRASGFNVATSAVRGGRRLIAVVMGGKTAAARDRQMAHLLDTAFDGGVAVASTARPPRRSVGQVASAADTPWRHAARSPAMERDAAAAPAAPVLTAASAGGAGMGMPAGLAGDRSWAIQVGVFSNPSSAESVAHKAARLLDDLPEAVTVGVTTKARPGAGPLYRARIMGVSRELALDACKQLVRRQMECWPVAAAEPAA